MEFRPGRLLPAPRTSLQKEVEGGLTKIVTFIDDYRAVLASQVELHLPPGQTSQTRSVDESLYQSLVQLLRDSANYLSHGSHSTGLPSNLRLPTPAHRSPLLHEQLVPALAQGAQIPLRIFRCFPAWLFDIRYCCPKPQAERYSSAIPVNSFPSSAPVGSPPKERKRTVSRTARRTPSRCNGSCSDCVG